MAIYRGPGGSGDATTDAANQASVASNKAAEAAISATAAAGSASSASTSASTATTRASEASTSATNASNSETAAASSATSAATSATDAATSETNAATSATTATTQASAASTSADAASDSELAAAVSASDAADSFDSFDDRYLGAKSSAPTVDNDGDALITGALYFNTTAGVMYVYTGSTWVAAYVSATGVLLQANNLSDVASAGTSRTNLGLIIGTDVQAFSSVLAATTASYTTAEESKLSGIETAADVTDATNVTAAGALMDSELTAIADVKALDQSVVSGASPTFSIANMTLDDTDLVVVDTTNLQTFAVGVDQALLHARGTGISTTYVSTISVGGTTFAQPTVTGEINSDQGYFHVTYAGATGITVTDLTAASTYVYIDNTGALQQQVTTPTRQDWSRKMFTMRIAVNTTTQLIVNFAYLNNPIGHYANSIRDVYSYLLAQGIPFKKNQTVTGRAGDLGFDVGAGTLMEFGGTGDINNANIKSFDAVSNTSYSLLSRTAIISSETNLVKYWDNAGTITALGSTTFVGHRLYRFSSGAFAMQYGQGNYANLVLAKAGVLLEDYVVNTRLENATFFGWWFIESTATNTGGTTLTSFVEYTIGVQGGSSSSLAGALLKGNNLSDLLDASAARTNLGLAIGTDVQALATTVAKTSSTGSAVMPTGTTAQRDVSPTTGNLRFNSTDTSFEGYNGSAWGAIGGGASGGGSDAIFYENGQSVTTDYTIVATNNAMSTGPITINSGVTVTVSSGARYIVI